MHERTKSRKGVNRTRGEKLGDEMGEKREGQTKVMPRKGIGSFGKIFIYPVKRSLFLIFIYFLNLLMRQFYLINTLYMQQLFIYLFMY